jgi:hypothetical protein
MSTSPFSSAADLSSAQRQAVESMVGRTLESQDMVFLVVLRPGQEPTAEDKARARARLERVFQQADRFGQEQGIDPVAADAAIDAAVQDVRSRAP